MVFDDESVEAALDRSLRNAKHLRAKDAAAVALARSLARKIDAWDVIVGWALDDVAEADGKARPAVPQNDNVSTATMLKTLTSLQLVPGEVVATPAKKPASTLDKFQYGKFKVINGEG